MSGRRRSAWVGWIPAAILAVLIVGVGKALDALNDVTIGLELVAQASTSGSDCSALTDVTPSPLQFFVGQNNASQPC